MKKISIALVAGLLIVASCKSKKTTTEAAADAPAPTEEVRKPKSQRGGESLDDRLAMQEEMYTSIGLDDGQKTKFRAIETKYAKEMRAAREATEGNRDAMRTAMSTIQENKTSEISSILSPEQFVKYKEELSKMREGRREGRRP